MPPATHPRLSALGAGQASPSSTHQHQHQHQAQSQRHHLPEQAGGVMTPSSSSSSVPSPSARPRSSGHFHGGSSGPYARPTNERHSITAIAHHPPREVQAAPRMVALAGWPEPIYIDTTLSSRSRPSSRRQSFSSPAMTDAENAAQAVLAAHRSRPLGTVSAGPSRGSSRSSSPTGKRKFEDMDHTGWADIAMSRSGSAQSRTEYRSSPRNMTPPPYDARPPYPTSSTRSSFSDAEQPFDHERAASIHAAQRRSQLDGAAAAGTPPLPGPRRSTFADPRMAPHVGVFSNRGPLAIAPSWVGSEPHTNAPVALTGVAVEAGQRGTGILVLPAVPEVYPRRRPSTVSSPLASASPAAPPQRAWSPEGSAMSHGGVGGMDFAGGHRMGSLASAFAGLVSGGTAAMMPGMATEMYPRDPESPMWWVNDVPAARAALSPMAVVSPPPSGPLTPVSVPTDTMPITGHLPARAGSMDGHRPTVRFKTDSRPSSPGLSSRQQQHSSSRMHKPAVMARYKADEERSELLSVHAQ